MKLCSWLGPCDPSIHNEPSPLTFGLNHSSVFKHSSSCCCRTEDICMTSSVSQHCDIRLAICSYSRTCCSWGEIWYAHKSTSKWYKRVLSVSFIQRRMHCKKRQLIVNSACFYCEQINAKSTHWMLSVCIPWSHVETAIMKKNSERDCGQSIMLFCVSKDQRSKCTQLRSGTLFLSGETTSDWRKKNVFVHWNDTEISFLLLPFFLLLLLIM